MGALKKIVAGGIVAAGGVGLQVIGGAIFSTTGTAEGVFLDYRSLIGMASTGLLALGALIGLYGLLEGVYRLASRGEEDDGGDAESTSSPSRSAPASQRDRPRSPSRS